MVRSTLSPGPFEGRAVLARDGERVGTVDSLVVVGQSVAALAVRLDDGSLREVPRDWFSETVPRGMLLARAADEVRGLAPAGRQSKG